MKTVLTKTKIIQRSDPKEVREGEFSLSHQAAKEVTNAILTFVPTFLKRVNVGLTIVCQQNDFSQVTFRQGLMLLVLYRNEKVTLKVLAETILESPSSVSIMIQRLVKKKLVARIADTQDRRQVIITLLEKGVQLANAIEILFADTLTELCSHLDAKETGSLENIFRFLSHHNTSNSTQQ